MPALTTAQEYQGVRMAIQYLTTLGADSMPHAQSFQLGDMNVTYGPSITITYLREREIELANRICNVNRRKRVSPDFSYDA